MTAFLRPGGPGRALHAALEEFNDAPGTHSWLDTFWPYRYLGRRDRIALNANFFFLFKDADLPQVERAAGLIAAALDYKRLIDGQLLPPAVVRGQPQTMEQNKYLFSTTRIPGAELDTVRSPYTPQWPGPSQARHVVVFFRGAMFRLDVLGADGVPHSLDDLAAGLRAVIAGGARPGAEDAEERSAGHLTTMARAEWAAARQSLLDCHPGNAAALEDIETALFCVCLEDVAPDRHPAHLRPAALRRRRQPLVRQGGVTGRVRRRPGRDQHRALRARRHHHPPASWTPCWTPPPRSTRCGPAPAPRERRCPSRSSSCWTTSCGSR